MLSVNKRLKVLRTMKYFSCLNTWKSSDFCYLTTFIGASGPLLGRVAISKCLPVALGNRFRSVPSAQMTLIGTVCHVMVLQCLCIPWVFQHLSSGYIEAYRKPWWSNIWCPFWLLMKFGYKSLTPQVKEQRLVEFNIITNNMICIEKRICLCVFFIFKCIFFYYFYISDLYMWFQTFGSLCR